MGTNRWRFDYLDQKPLKIIVAYATDGMARNFGTKIVYYLWEHIWYILPTVLNTYLLYNPSDFFIYKSKLRPDDWIKLLTRSIYYLLFAAERKLYEKNPTPFLRFSHI